MVVKVLCETYSLQHAADQIGVTHKTALVPATATRGRVGDGNYL